MSSRHAGRSRFRIRRIEFDASERSIPESLPQMRITADDLATEEPLEIRLRFGRTSPGDPGVLPVQDLRLEKTVPLALTMRTPGDDYDLAAGFLYSEGIVQAPADIVALSHCIDPEVDAEQQHNIVNVDLQAGITVDLRRLERHFFSSSACGVCGKAQLEQISLKGQTRLEGGPRVRAEIIRQLPQRLRGAQGLFEQTGGLHAAGVFSPEGDLLQLREDVGRHNALDKLIGSAFLNAELPFDEHIVVVSGRASYELMQKCLAAGVRIVCAVSAPSSLAVDLAREFGITLVGFLRENRFNVYAGMERIDLPEGP